MERYQVPVEKLRRRLDPATLAFKSTQDVSPLRGTLGQQRAMEALQFGTGMDSPGFNLFVTGLSGTGRTHTVREYLEEIAASRPAPDDWIYVHNFEQPDRPIALHLAARRGRELAADMERFIRQAREQISHAFETERYAERRQQLANES